MGRVHPIPVRRLQPVKGKPPLLPGNRSRNLRRESAEASDRRIGLDEFEIVHHLPKVGVWWDVLSTYLNRVLFDWVSPWGGSIAPPSLPDWFGNPEDRTGYLSIEFLDLAIVGYPDRPYKVFDDLINSPSKGVYMHYGSSNLQGDSGDKIRPAQRIVTSKMIAERDRRQTY